jgi:hypothetical protein
MGVGAWSSCVFDLINPTLIELDTLGVRYFAKSIC